MVKGSTGYSKVPYLVISAKGEIELEVKAKELIDKGYIPIGGVSTFITRKKYAVTKLDKLTKKNVDEIWFSQAFILKDKL